MCPVWFVTHVAGPDGRGSGLGGEEVYASHAVGFVGGVGFEDDLAAVLHGVKELGEDAVGEGVFATGSLAELKLAVGARQAGGFGANCPAGPI